jgi:hypothetical protein
VNPPHLLAAADWFEILAALIFLLVTGAAQFLQKRARQKQGLPPLNPEGTGSPWGEPWAPPAPGPAPAPPRTPPPRPGQDWEEALRRALGIPAPPVTPPRLPPQSTPASPAPTPDTEVALEEAWSLEEGPAPEEHLSPLPGAGSAWHRAEAAGTEADSRLANAGSLASATRALAHAGQLHEIVTARMRAAQALAHHAGPTPPRPRVAPNTATTLVRSLLGNRETVRQAVVASAILGPPKALE